MRGDPVMTLRIPQLPEHTRNADSAGGTTVIDTFTIEWILGPHVASMMRMFSVKARKPQNSLSPNIKVERPWGPQGVHKKKDRDDHVPFPIIEPGARATVP